MPSWRENMLNDNIFNIKICVFASMPVYLAMFFSTYLILIPIVSSKKKKNRC